MSDGGRKKRHPFYGGKDWLGVRRKVLARDGYRCVVCGADVRGAGNARVDHVEPRTERPDLALEPSNLRTLCVSCDGLRHNRDKWRKAPGVRLDGFPDDGSWD